MKQLENCLVVANGIGYIVSQSCYGVFPQMYKEIILIVSAVFGPCFRLCFRSTADSELVTSHQDAGFLYMSIWDTLPELYMMAPK